MREFNLFEHNFSFDDDFELWNKYIIKSKRLMKDKANEISKTFQSISSIEEFIISTISIRNTYLENITEIYTESAQKWNLETFFLQDIINAFSKTREKLDTHIATLFMEYISIIEIYKELEINRYLQQFNIRRWYGGGFGIAGAIKGALTADAMNSATNFLYKIKDSRIACSNNRKIDELSNKLISKYRDEHIFEDVIRDYIYSCSTTFFNLLEYHNIIKIPNFNYNEAIQIYNNLVVNESNHKTKLKNSIICITKYPYEIKFYEALFAEDPRNIDLINIVEFFGLSESNLCISYKKKYNEIDVEKRTFNKITYETRDERILAEKYYIKKIKKITKILNNRFHENNIDLNNFDSLEKYHKCLDVVGDINEEYDINIVGLLDTELIKDEKWIEQSNLSNDIKLIKSIKKFLNKFNEIENDIRLYKNKSDKKEYFSEDRSEIWSSFFGIIFTFILTCAIFFFAGFNFFVILSAIAFIGSIGEFIENKAYYRNRKKEMKSNYYKYSDKGE